MYKLRAVFVYADNTKKIDFMKEKLSYTAPSAEPVVVQADGIICVSTMNIIYATDAGVAGATMEYNDVVSSY